MTKITIFIDADNGSSESAKIEHMLTDFFYKNEYRHAGFGKLARLPWGLSKAEDEPTVEFVHSPPPAAVAPSASISTLDIVVDSTQVKEATKALNDLADAAARARQAIEAL